MRILNLYAGLGGNRKLWKHDEIVSVERDPQIAKVYRRLYPLDQLIEGDAPKYLLQNSDRFDFIWSSPPCQSHGRMVKASRHKPKAYPDMSLYQQIIFLQNFAKCPWVVENVIPYYTPLIAPTAKIGRHFYWSNFPIPEFDEPKAPANFINLCNLAGKKILMDWLDIHYEENIYHEGSHCPAQILRNCVHPEAGLHVLNAAREHKTA